MKKMIIAGLTFFLLAGIAGAAEQVVFVDLSHVFDEFYKTQLAKSKLDVQRKDIEEEHQAMVDEMKQISEQVDDLKKEARDVTWIRKSAIRREFFSKRACWNCGINRKILKSL